MNRTRTLTVAGVGVALAVGLAGCSGDNGTPVAPGPGSAVPTVAVNAEVPAGGTIPGAVPSGMPMPAPGTMPDGSVLPDAPGMPSGMPSGFPSGMSGPGTNQAGQTNGGNAPGRMPTGTATGNPAPVPTINMDIDPDLMELISVLVANRTPTTDAKAQIENAGFTSRIVEEDGQGMAATADYRPQRINLIIADGVVIGGFPG